MSENKNEYMQQHHAYFGPAYFVRAADVSAGDVITFSYKGEMRWVFVLDPNYEDKLHGLTLGRTPRKAIVGDVITAMYETDQPIELYEREVYRLAQQWDSYRTFLVQNISQLRRLPYYLSDKEKEENNRNKRIS